MSRRGLWTALIASGLIASTALSCAQQMSAERMTTKQFGVLEPLLDYKVDAKQITVSVMSTGCTQVDDFSLEVSQVDGVCEIAIYRQRPDRCRRAPFPQTLILPWDALQRCGDAVVKVVNSVTGPKMPR